MLKLSAKMKALIGDGRRTTLFPLVRIYRNLDEIENDFWDFTNQPVDTTLNFSIKDVTLKSMSYVPNNDLIPFDGLLLNSPNIVTSSDAIENKFKISNVTLDVSNYPHNGKVLSDTIEDYYNAVCQVYYCAEGITDIEDCLLVYTGLLRRYMQQSDKLTLTIEDIVQQKLSTKIPINKVPENSTYYKEDDWGKPFPAVFGFVRRSPTITRLNPSTEEYDFPTIAALELDNKDSVLEGVWTSPNDYTEYGNPHITEGHPLVDDEWLIQGSYLSFYEDGYIPIMKNQVREWQTPEDLQFNAATNFYHFENTSEEYGPRIILNEVTDQNDDVQPMLPSRVYRPISSVSFTVHNDNDQGSGDHDSWNGFVGFTHRPSGTVWSSWANGRSRMFEAYDENWGIEGENVDTSSRPRTWWQPTYANEAQNSTRGTDIDENWRDLYGEDNATFPVNRIQDGQDSTGIHVSMLNSDGPDKSGNAWAAIMLKSNVADWPCATTVIADVIYHTVDVLDPGEADGSGSSRKTLPVRISQSTPGWYYENHYMASSAHELAEENHGGSANDPLKLPSSNMPNYDELTLQFANNTIDTTGTNSSAGHYFTHAVLQNWDRTTSHSTLYFGQGRYHVSGDQGNDRMYLKSELLNMYVLQDVLVTQIHEKDYYVDVLGRKDSLNFLDVGNIDYNIFWESMIGSVIEVHFTEHHREIGEWLDLDGDGVDDYYAPMGDYTKPITLETEINGRLVGDYVPDGYDGEPVSLYNIKIPVIDNNRSDIQPDNLIKLINTPYGDTSMEGHHIVIDKTEDTIVEINGTEYEWENVWIVELKNRGWHNLGQIQHVEIIEGESDINENFEFLETPHRIMQNIFNDEIKYDVKFNYESILEADTACEGWRYGFSIHEQITAKDFTQDFFQSSIIIPTFDSGGSVKYLVNYQLLEARHYENVVKSEDVLKYRFEKTKIDDVKTQVNIKYGFDYAENEFTKETGFSVVDNDGVSYPNIQVLTNTLHGSQDNEDLVYDMDYYRTTVEDSKFEFETKYITDETTARLLQKRLLLWYCNQHLIVKFDLPISYMYLEVGDYIRFDKLLGNNEKAFGSNYTIWEAKNGQLIYPAFYITKIKKTLKQVSVECVQTHRGQYGFDPEWETWSFEDGYVPDDVGWIGNDPEDHFEDQFNPEDDEPNPDYDEDGWTSDDYEPYVAPLTIKWVNKSFNLRPYGHAIIRSNIGTGWGYKIWINYVSADVEYVDDNGETQILRQGYYNPPLDGNIIWDSTLVTTQQIGDMNNLYIYRKYRLDGGVKVSGSLEVSTRYANSDYDLRNGERTEGDPTDPFTDEIPDDDPEYDTAESASVGFYQLGSHIQSGGTIIPDYPTRLGDINEDGLINVLDVVTMVNHITAGTADEEILETGDMNQDGSVNVIDCVQLVNEILS